MTAQSLFHVMVEDAPTGMVVVDAQRRITLVNRSAIELLGHAREDLVGQPIGMVLSDAVARDDSGRDADADPYVGGDYMVVRKDGTPVPVEIAFRRIRTDDGAFTVASLVDISKRKRAEDELRRSNAELEQFAYVASHDLQEPLRMVASYTELLAQRYRGRLDEKADKYIEYAVDGTRRMQRLVMDLLAYSRVGSGGNEVGPVRSAAVVEQVLRVLAGTIRAAGATIEVGELPVVMADETQLGQLVQNLVTNALKFRGDDAPRLRIDAAREGEMWRFTVADNGIGIDPRHHDRAFQMFQRLHDRSRFEGSGIGLAVAKRIVERHGGRIWFTSSDVGTTFHFTLPSGRGAADP